MATLDVEGVKVVGFPADTTITTSDGEGGTATWIALADTWVGVPDGTTSMTVTPAGKAMCMTEANFVRSFHSALQVMVVNEVRTSA